MKAVAPVQPSSIPVAIPPDTCVPTMTTYVGGILVVGTPEGLVTAEWLGGNAFRIVQPGDEARVAAHATACSDGGGCGLPAAEPPAGWWARVRAWFGGNSGEAS